MTCLQFLLCDNLKCETRDAAANPDCQGSAKPGSVVLNGAHSQTVFSSVWVWGECCKEETRAFTPPTEERLLFLFSKHNTKRRNTKTQARWCYSDFKQRVQLHMNVKVLVRIQVIHLNLFIHNSFLWFYVRWQGILSKLLQSIFRVYNTNRNTFLPVAVRRIMLTMSF